MRRLALVLLALGLAASSRAAETLAVMAVADPPAGPGPDLAEATHQLRAACRDRAEGVQEGPEMRARLLGRSPSASLAELDRAYAGALATYQNEEYEGSIRTLRAIIEDLEKLPESPEAYAQWIRAQLRLAHAETTVGRRAEARAAMDRVAAIEPDHLVDPELYSPTYRREFEEARRRRAALPTRRLAITASGHPGQAFVNGKALGSTPAAVSLPPGRYRVGGFDGSLRVPGFWVALGEEDRTVELDFGLAAALRVDAGPGLALPPDERAAGLVRAGAWLGVDRLIAAAVVSDGGAEMLAGSLYDVRRGSLVREGRVRMVAGAVPSVHIGALSSFLLTGQPARGVVSVALRPLVAEVADEPAVGAEAPPSPAPQAGGSTRGWMRPAAIASGVFALGLAGVATWQGLSARDDYGKADGMLRPDGAFVAGADPARYRQTLASADAARRNAYLGAAGAVVFAAVAGVLGYLSIDGQLTPAVRF